MQPIYHEMPNHDEDGQTPASIAAARAERDAQRAKATAETGVRFNGDGTLILPRRLALLKMPRHYAEIDALFTAPSAVERVHVMQLEEERTAHDVAEVLADRVLGSPLKEIEDRRQRAACRFLAIHAMRSLSPAWVNAATSAAIQGCAEHLRTEGGAGIAEMPAERLEAIAASLAPAVLAAYFGVTEGTRAVTPGQYLRVVNQGAK